MNTSVSVYNSILMREALDDALRPGGLTSTRDALEFMKLPDGSLVLDAGCGPGKTVDYLHNHGRHRVVGLDLNRDLLPANSFAPDSRIIFTCADTCHLPLGSGILDAVLCECVLSLVSEAEHALAEFYRVLKKGGYLYYSDMFVRKNINPALNNSCSSCLTRAESRQVLRKRLLGSGFKILFEEDQSRLLKQTAGRLIFEYGSMEVFWQAILGTKPGTDCASQIQSQKPGYISFLAIKD